MLLSRSSIVSLLQPHRTQQGLLLSSSAHVTSVTALCCCSLNTAATQALPVFWGHLCQTLMMLGSQDAKLLRLEASLHQREEQIENHHAERINALRSRRSREVQHKLAYVHRYCPTRVILECSELSF